MANPNALIVEVVGDTRGLTKGLADAERQMSKFASSQRSWANRSARTGVLKESFEGAAALHVQAEAAKKEMAAAEERLAAMQGGLGRTAVKAGVAGFAIYALGQNMQSLGGDVGKLGSAFSSLASGNIVGFVQALKSVSDTDPAKIGQDLIKYGDAAKAADAANKAAAAGFDQLATAANAAAGAIRSAAAAQSALADESAKVAFAAGNEAAAFGELENRFGRGPGSATASNALEAASGGTFHAPDPKKKRPRRRGITAAQRNQWFDSRISRELDRVQDVKTISGQVKALRAIEAEIQKRIDVTKDITRKLKLEDDLIAVQRREAALRKNKPGDNLTATTQLNAGILEGIGLSRAAERTLRARLSNFNSAGVGLAGGAAGAGAVHTTVVVDGKVVAKASAKYNRRGGKLNPTQRNGPNAGTQVS